MTVNELIEKLNSLSEEEKEFTVVGNNFYDDPYLINNVSITIKLKTILGLRKKGEDYSAKITVIQIA